MSVAAEPSDAGARPSRGAFSPAAVAWMIAVGITAVCAMLMLTAFEPQLRRTDNGGGHVLSRSAMGFAALARLLGEDGQPVRVLRGPAKDKSGLVILTPEIQHAMAAVQAVEAAGPRLVILPKWETVPDPKNPRRVMIERILPQDAIERQIVAGYAPNSKVLRRSDTLAPVLTGDDGRVLPVGPVRRLQTFEGPGWRPIVRAADGGLVVGCLDDVCVLSDPDLANTHGLADLRTARFAVGLIERLKRPGPITFDATLHGFSDNRRNLTAVLVRPPFLGVTLSLLAAAVLLGAHALARFGPTVAAGRAIALGKSGLADNTAALIRRAGREHSMLRRYALAQRDAVAAALGAPRHLDEAGLEAFLDRLSAAAGAAKITDLLAQARAVGPRGDLMGVAQSLHQWRVEMTRER